MLFADLALTVLEFKENIENKKRLADIVPSDAFCFSCYLSAAVI